MPLGVANVVRTGTDVTVVAHGRMVREALAAADALAGDGISIEVIDPRTLQPFDLPTVLSSVAKTHRALVVHEAVRFGGIGAEIAAQIAGARLRRPRRSGRPHRCAVQPRAVQPGAGAGVHP